MRPSTTTATDYSNRWLLLGIVATLMPVIGYILLPSLGIHSFVQLFELKRLYLLVGALFGGGIYIHYFRFVLARPQLLVGFIAIAWPVVDYVSGQLMHLGINLHLRPLILLGIAIPGIIVSLQHAKALWQQFPWMKYYLFFFAWLMFYTIFFNVNARDPYFDGGEGSFAEGSVSVIQVTAYLYCLLCITISGVTILKSRKPQALFDVFNKAFVIISMIEALVTIMGFPFGLFSMVIDGFNRAVGIFGHPNPYAHHMAIVMIYMLGLFCYYQGEREKRFPSWLLFTSLGVNLIAFLLGLSKTALGVFALCALLILVLNLGVPAIRKGFLKMTLAGIVLVPVGLLGYQAFTGNSFLAVLESRIEQTESMSWRALIWQELLANINLATVWFGHGFTAANETVYQASYSDSTNSKPLMMVHNAYIALIYDLGILGYSMFAASITLCWQSITGWLNANKPEFKTEYSIILALSLYFLIVCGFDEMSYMFDAPMLYWLLCSVLYGMSQKETSQPIATQQRYFV